jgi:voltage-gated potassium channel
MRLRQLALIVSLPVLLLGAGTAGFMAVEGWPAFEALYMTVITVTTVGFMEVRPLSVQGRAFTMLLALGGVFTLFYAAAEVIRAVVSGELRGALGRERMERSLSRISDHCIVCGFGRMGRLVCQEFSALGSPFVVVDRDDEALRSFALPHGFPLHGDATSEEVLRRAGIDRARVLVSLAASDADNLYITMTARLMNDRLRIVARAEDEAAAKKLERAGANRVVSPYVIGGQRVALAVLRPSVVDFLELATRSEHLDLQIEEAVVRERSPLAGKNLRESGIRQDLGIIVVAIKRPDGRMTFNPASEFVLSVSDTLIALGHRKQLDRLEALAGA